MWADKDKFMSLYWVEDRHETLMGMEREDARELVESLTEDEIGRNVNCREHQHDYICDFLADLWEISPKAFWSHIRVALGSCEGLVVGDRPDHAEIMAMEDMPPEVLAALLDSLTRETKDFLRDILTNALAFQTTEAPSKNRHRRMVLDYVRVQPGAGCERMIERLVQVLGPEASAWIARP